ncbi:hypothetical protein NBRC10512_007702 [Rhodotorula toruloides]|uniref:ATP-dependent DNA helicase n=2 Tax=Rhodotorula toruloides TaxID=5286 RepID=A0A061AWL7_RHOTO|nr:ATP-dependent helicase [Rhodotorula toruloides NP11]EMS24138.1 ATP-dependent helicase [Rhodotorula toruloides NP11]CDR41594.1 RHTO0S06e03312g1_1 [Rhodotorula toruloides]
MEVAYAQLKRYWGFPSFRGVQAEVIQRLVVESQNALCIMPTGGGKSLVFQVPALCFDGLTLVISPLIALSKDQVDNLKKRGVPAAALDSSLTTEESSEVRRQLREGTLKILYVAPERLNNEMFVSMISEQKISLLAVDESHCVSEWGPSFRAEYLKVSRFAKEIAAERVLCLTATATPSVITDICDSTNGFDIDREKGVFSTGTFRPNLSISIKPCANFKAKFAVLVPALKSRGDGAAIVYVTTQKQAEEVAQELHDLHGIEARPYHAGLKADDRKTIQDWFIGGNGVVVATIAFGMGIDKANIRMVAHFQLPKTLENYSQEIGRAGRDGLPSLCLMVPSASDMPILESFARANTPSLRSIRTWLDAFFISPLDDDGTISADHYKMSNEFDIGRNTLSLLFTILELQYGLIRATTPFYSTYTIKPLENNPSAFPNVLSDRSPEAVALQKHWKQGRIWHTIDVVGTAEAEGIERSKLVRQISRWEMNGWCEVKVGGVRMRYKIENVLPELDEDIEELANAIFKQLHEREEADVKRLRNVAEFVKGGQCYAHLLACYFGDDKAVPEKGCGICSFCKTRQAIPFQPKYDSAFSDKQVRFVLGVCGVRDDPRFLARFAFGVSSPRITQLGLSKHEIFGCCETADFNKLLERFEAECEEQGYRNRAVLAPPKTNARAKEGEADGKEATGAKKAPAKRAASGGAKAGGAAKKAKK